MKLSTRGRYALKCMIAIARMGEEGQPISLERVADAASLSKRYLEQLVIGLKNASLVRALPGRSGGYLLARRPEDIRIGEIIEASIGPVNVVECAGRPEACHKVAECECRLLYMLINQRVLDALNEYKLSDLLDRKKVMDLAGSVGDTFYVGGDQDRPSAVNPPS